jgi:hypothetical protein
MAAWYSTDGKYWTSAATTSPTSADTMYAVWVNNTDDTWPDDNAHGQASPEPEEAEEVADEPRRAKHELPPAEPRPNGVRETFPRAVDGGGFDAGWPRPPP